MTHLSCFCAVSALLFGVGLSLAFCSAPPPRPPHSLFARTTAPPSRPPSGRVLKGHLTLGQLRRGGGAAPAKHAVQFVAPPPPSKDAGGGKKKGADGGAGGKAAAAADGASGAGKKDAEARASEALRDAKLALMRELRPEADGDAGAAAVYERLAAEVAAVAPAHLPLLLELLRRCALLGWVAGHAGGKWVPHGGVGIGCE